MGAKGRLALISCILLILTCGTWVSLSYDRQPVNKEAIVLQTKRVANPNNIRRTDTGVGLLKDGDVVVRTGADITSYMFTQMNLQDKTYSHCGLVKIENGYPFVYHSIGGEDNPDQEIKRDSACFWFSPANNLGFGIVRLNVSDSNIHDILRATETFYRDKRKFDMEFDLRTDDRLYCAEFVYKVLNKAMKDSNFIRYSTMFGYSFVAIDNLFLNSHARFVYVARYE